jgi:hypothetical protein
MKLHPLTVEHKKTKRRQERCEMSGVPKSVIGALEHGVAVAVGLSVVFLALLALASPVVATGVVVPAAIAVGAARTRLVPLATPHSLTAPSVGADVVVNAPKAAAAVSRRSASSAA